MNDEKQKWMMEAAEEAWYAWYRYAHASTPIEAADYLVDLSNKMFDLATYSPRFDERTGQLEFDDE